MGSTDDIKKGLVIRKDGNLYVVNDFNFVNPGKGAAFYKTKMKDISAGKTIEVTYKSGEGIDTVDVHRQTLQFLYAGTDRHSFMNKDTYETLEVDADVVGEDAKYLREGLDVVAAMHDGNIVAIELPKKIQYTVKSAPPAVKGDSASGNVTKDIILDNDLEVKAPIFIKEGDEILVNTETGDYGGRVNE
ncbi:MAG: elongation factor P [Candidatus Magasanikbacteria bacterium CG_4_9_14_0_2_um_filter_42_11]|uniref:Elongation factor P n=1 Tax=Candidatus Magasanikbacteria bacterium CG_4_9_14_0_2_um_filter_42_11 TaxID=1974643 RepID=A0A2M8F9I0_9BACT|nr:MAG: elongation factor P [Candidatus Magasanikbacteria bacterium CG10_big_fil_rev_8_21_14_0_10_43_9]PIY93026.1 MAG: elongation factor P [Candidatus Magasanikbacteria bacterium CG_4_10_14_0_8_um_filter_42_12]PJC52390.1 MAG: elongation factor P [Candidatus Magasanikbacteria bacterium CG_4_9_14_0_2_um_filter_42_11]